MLTSVKKLISLAVCVTTFVVVLVGCAFASQPESSIESMPTDVSSESLNVVTCTVPPTPEFDFTVAIKPVEILAFSKNDSGWCAIVKSEANILTMDVPDSILDDVSVGDTIFVTSYSDAKYVFAGLNPVLGDSHV